VRKIDLFAKDFIVIPLFEEEHWSLIIICYPYNLYSNDASMPTFLFLDSLVTIPPIYEKHFVKVLDVRVRSEEERQGRDSPKEAKGYAD